MMVQSRQTNALMFVATIVCALVMMTVSSLAHAQQMGGVMMAAMTAEPPGLDPHAGTSAATRNVAHHVFETLVTYDEGYAIVPQLASSWDVDETGTTFTFHLRQDVRFHDGTTMTSEDVLATFARYREIGTRSRDFEDVVSIEAPDDSTVVVTLQGPDGAFLAKLANPGAVLVIMPASEAASREPLRPPHLIGTGPYVIAEWSPGERIRLERFEDYSRNVDVPASGLAGDKVAYFDEIWFVPIPEAGARVAGMETGAYQFGEGIPVTSLARIEASTDLNAYVIKPKWKIAVNFNHYGSFFDNVTARQALLAAIDFDELLAAVTAGRTEFYRAQPGLFFNEQATWHTTVGGEAYNQQDQELARRLFAEAGYQGQELVMVTTRDFDWMYKTALAIQAQLREIDVNLRLDLYDWAAQRAKTAETTGWDLGTDGKSMRLDPNDYAATVLCESSSNFGYCSTTMDQLISDGATASDTASRQAVYAEVQELQWADLPWLPVGDLFELEAAASKVHGYESWYTPRFWNVWFE